MKILLALFPQLLSALLMSLFEEELLLGDAELEIPDEGLTLRGEGLVVGEGVEAVEEDPVVPHLLLSLRAHNLRLREVKGVKKHLNNQTLPSSVWHPPDKPAALPRSSYYCHHCCFPPVRRTCWMLLLLLIICFSPVVCWQNGRGMQKQHLLQTPKAPLQALAGL